MTATATTRTIVTALGCLALGAATEVLDLQGATVLPGLHDMHVHPIFAGTEQYACGFPPGASPEVIAEAVADCVAEKQPGEWIHGGNWVAAVFERGEQTKEFLDNVAPDNPVVLSDESHHSIWVNSAALERAAIDDHTPNPPGGIIERDSDGKATGLLRETGMRGDFIVVDRNPFEVPVTEVHATQVQMTFIDGEKVFDRDNPPPLSAD